MKWINRVSFDKTEERQRILGLIDGKNLILQFRAQMDTLGTARIFPVLLTLCRSQQNRFSLSLSYSCLHNRLQQHFEKCCLYLASDVTAEGEFSMILRDSLLTLYNFECWHWSTDHPVLASERSWPARARNMFFDDGHHLNLVDKWMPVWLWHFWQSHQKPNINNIFQNAAANDYANDCSNERKNGPRVVCLSIPYLNTITYTAL